MLSLKRKAKYFFAKFYDLFCSVKDRVIYRNKGMFGNFFSPDYSRFDLDYMAFDEAYYFAKNPDLAKCADAYSHFVKSGYESGREGRFFDSVWYRNQYRDVELSGLSPLVHYRKFGLNEGRQARFTHVKINNANEDEIDYVNWIDSNSEILNIPDDQLKSKISELKYLPKISIILPTYESEKNFLKQAIESVINQSYANWQLCVVDDASTDRSVASLIKDFAKNDSRIEYQIRRKNGHISEASNTALNLSSGEFVGLLDHDDLLHKDALFCIVRELNINQKLDLLYTDEDKCDVNGLRFDPYFKPDFNYELLLAQNMVSHFGVYRKSKIVEIGGFRKGFEGAQDYDLLLRFIEKTSPEKIKHIPRVLYHWRATASSTALTIAAKPYAAIAGKRAVEEHLFRQKEDAIVTQSPELPGHWRVRFGIPIEHPLISIIIPTRDLRPVLNKCIDSILYNSTYRNYEILVINNQSRELDTIEYLAKISSENIRIIDFDEPFNFSKLNNYAVNFARGEFILFLNNDTEVITPEWLEEMVSFAQRPQIGCVGARLWYPDNTLQHGGVILGIGGTAGHSHKNLPKGQTGYFGRAVHHQEMSAITGACLMVKKSTFQKVGGFDENLSVAFNDIDFCLKLKTSGYRNIWTPYAELYHYESKTRGNEDTQEKINRFATEVKLMNDKWGRYLQNDDCYNPNLTLTHENFSLAIQSRVNCL